MIYHCTLVPSSLMQSAPAAGSTPDGQLIELSVEVPDPCPGADLEAAVARRYGTGELSVRGAPVAAMTVGVPPLVHGAVLVESAVLVEGAGLRDGIGRGIPLRAGPTGTLPRCCSPWTAVPARARLSRCGGDGSGSDAAAPRS